MKSFIKKREELQSEVQELFLNLSGDDKLFSEIPTGSGKGNIAAKCATAKQKQGIATIISSNSNKNAKELHDRYVKEAKAAGLSGKDVAIEIGRSNYVDLPSLYDALLNKAVVYDNLSAKDIKSRYYDKGKEQFTSNLLIDDLLEEFKYDVSDIDKFTAFLQDDPNNPSAKMMVDMIEHLKNNRVVITNHAYLIIAIRILSGRRTPLDADEVDLLVNTPIILDELHSLYQIAKGVFSNRFSLFRLKYSIASLLQVAADDITSVTKTQLRTILAKIINTEKRINSKLSQYDLRMIMADFKADIGGSRKINSLKNRVSKISLVGDKAVKYKSFLSTELGELAIVNLHKSIGVTVTLSPKGFPSVEVSNGIPSYKLRSLFWLKHRGVVMGMSGTLRSEAGDDFEAYRWLVELIGLYSVDDLDDRDLSFEGGEGIYKAEVRLGKSIDNMKLVKYESLFSKSNYLYTIIDDDSLELPVFRKHSEDELKIKKEEWRENVGTFVGSTMMHNALVLVVGYDDASHIAKRIKELRDDVVVHMAKEGVAMHQCVAAYMKDVDMGKLCCLVGTDQYYVGLDLPDEYLKELYIAKIPYLNPTGSISGKMYKYLSFSKRDTYFNETFFKFLQGKGRAIRGHDDKAILYILDKRFNNDVHAKYRKFLDSSATYMSADILLKKRELFLGKNPKNKFSHNLHLFFYPIFKNIAIDELCDKLKIDNQKEIDEVCRKLLNKEIVISNLEKDEIIEILNHKKFNIYSFLFKLLIQKKTKDIESVIIQNKLFGYENINELSLAFFQNKIPEVNKMISYH